MVAFLSFVITTEPPPAALYICELHVKPSIQRVGIGTHLIQVAEHVAREVGVAKTMLTVVADNVRADALFRWLGYSEDETSPPEEQLRGVVSFAQEFKILSRWMD